MTAGRKASPPNVAAAIRTLRLFEAFAAEPKPHSLSDISQKLDIPLSSCHLLLKTLLRRGYLYQVRNRYYPTRRMLQYMTRIAGHDPIEERLATALVALRDSTRETVTFAKLHQGRAIFLGVYDSPRILRPSMSAGNAGDIQPLHSTSTGKALLGMLDPGARAALLDRMKFSPFTAKTVRSREQFEAELRKMEARGWYLNNGETWDDVGGVSVGVSLDGEPYAITVLGPLHRIRPRFQDLAQALLQTKADLDQQPPRKRVLTQSLRRRRSPLRRAGKKNRTATNPITDHRSSPQ